MLWGGSNHRNTSNNKIKKSRLDNGERSKGMWDCKERDEALES